MRVLLVSTTEKIGGAAVSCRRLMLALKAEGIKSKMLVRDKQTQDSLVVALPKTWRHLWNFLWERVVIWKSNYFKKDNLFAVDIANTGTDITSLPEFRQADIIHLHWINQGMLSLKSIARILESGKPVVWTMHDMWPATSICHHARECVHYHAHCQECPYLLSSKKKDLSWRTWVKKARILKDHRITYIACSEWMQQQARKSALLQGKDILCIPNAINTGLFRKEDKQEARQACGLPSEGKLILFGSVKITDKRKGIDYFIASCEKLIQKHPEMRDQVGIVVFGSNSSQLSGMLPFKVYPMSFVSDERQLVDIYNAVDIYVTPSLEENLPNTIMEAMACGTPCVGFQIGGIPEMIDHLHNGYVARYKDTEDMANGINWVLSEDGYEELSREAARKVSKHYSQDVIAKAHIDLYNRLLKDHE